MTDRLAGEAEIQALTAAVEASDESDLPAVDALLDRYPDDPRLHFLKGSILAGRGKPIEAHEAMSRAIAIAPDFALARYQLGFFELTSGEADRALQTWGPLLRLDREQYLRRFVEGMAHLIRDEFEPAIAEFEAGIALNRENPPMNSDIRLLIEQCHQLAGGPGAGGPGTGGAADDADEEVSATALLLGQFGSRTLQ